MQHHDFLDLLFYNYITYDCFFSKNTKIMIQVSLEKDKRKPTQNQQRNRSNNLAISNTQISNSQSKKSQNPPQCKPCESHSFIFKPLPKHSHSYYSQAVKFNYTHQQKNAKPYPILFDEFIKKQYLPLFGLQHHMTTYRKKDILYKQSFYEQKVKETTEQKQHLTINSPVPKHNHCQICKKQFEIYIVHINQRNHIQNCRKGFGETCINQLLQDKQVASRNEREDRRLQLIIDFKTDLLTVIPLIRQKYRQFIKQFETLRVSS